MTQIKPTINNAHALAYINSRIWAMYPPKLRDFTARAMSQPQLERALSQSAAGGGDLNATMSVQPEPGTPSVKFGGERLEGCRYTYKTGNVAVIEIEGEMLSGVSYIDQIWAYYFGCTLTQVLTKDIQIAANDDDIDAILLRIDSPGGEAAGINELASAIFSARSKKPIHAYVYGLGCSAAYWAAAACNKIHTDSIALLGSIGVVAGWSDWTGFFERLGIAYEEVTSSNAPYKRLDIRNDEERAVFMSEIDGIEKIFIDGVAKYRGVKRDEVIANFGKGAVMAGHLAVRAGLADSVDSFESVLKKMRTQQRDGGKTSASAEEGKMGLSDTLKAMFGKFVDAEIEKEVPESTDTASSENEISTINDSATLNSEEDVASNSAAEMRQEKPQENQMSNSNPTPAPAATTETPAPAATGQETAPAAAADTSANDTRNAELDQREASLNAREQELAQREQAATQAQASAEAAERTTRFNTLAASFAGETEPKVAFMEKLAATYGEDSEEFNTYVTDQKALAAQIEAGSLFGEVGAPGANTSIDAETRMDTLAKERAAKDGISYEAAYSKVADENKALAGAAISGGKVPESE